MTMTNDLPFSSTSVANQLLDGNHRTYYIQDKGDAQVFVKKYVVKKSGFISYRGILGSRLANTNQFLIKIDNYTDIGGGRVTFLRHYAQLPQSWYSFEEKSALVYHSTGKMGINFDSRWGKFGYGTYAYAKRNVNYLAKATRYYVPKNILNQYVDSLPKYSLSGSFANGNFLRPDMEDDNELITKYINGEKRIIPQRLLVNAPIGKTTTTDTTEYAIAPDRVRLWQPGIYEITRYTASIAIKVDASTQIIPVSVSWRFDDTVTDKTGLIVDLVNQYSNVQELESVFQKDISSEDDKERFHGAAINVFGRNTAQVKEVITTGAILEEREYPFRGNQKVFYKWDGKGTSTQITIQFIIGNVFETI